MKTQSRQVLFSLIICLSFFGCQKEHNLVEETSKNAQDSPFSMRIISKNEINENTYVTEKLQPLSKYKSDKNTISKKQQSFSNQSSGALEKEVYNSEYDFTVNTDYAKYIESSDGTSHSYTFLIERDENNGLLENLVLTLQPDGTYKTEVVAYDFIDDETLEINTAPLENFDTSKYITRFSFYYECTQTITYAISYNDDCSCMYAEIIDVQTNCTYQYYNTYTYDSLDGGGGGGGGLGGTIWTGGGGSSGGTTTSSLLDDWRDDCTNSIAEELNLNAEQTECLNNSSYETVCGLNNDITDFLADNQLHSNPGGMGFLYNDPEAVAFGQEIVTALCNDEERTLDFLENFVFASPDNPIIDMQDYLDCIDTTQSADVTIYVNQPIANSDDTYTKGGDKAGHAFIGITQGNITRILGFYPDGDANPFSPEHPPVFNNDSGDAFDVSISKSVSAIQLSEMISETLTYNQNYNLNNNNCTDYAIVISQLAGFDIPMTIGYWPGGSGHNPAKFGQDIRSYNLEPGMIRNPFGGTAPQNNGTCE